MYDDEKTVAQQEEIRARERRQELEDIKKILQRPEGKRFFRRIFEIGHMFQTTYTGNSQGMFLEGHRNFALTLFHDIVEAAPERVQELIVKPEKEETNVCIS